MSFFYRQFVNLIVRLENQFPIINCWVGHCHGFVKCGIRRISGRTGCGCGTCWMARWTSYTYTLHHCRLIDVTYTRSGVPYWHSQASSTQRCLESTDLAPLYWPQFQSTALREAMSECCRSLCYTLYRVTTPWNKPYWVHVVVYSCIHRVHQ